MRLRNVKNKEIIMASSPYLVYNAKDYIGSWQELFHNDNPIYLEIGMGKGQFLIAQAMANPEINYIGIEKFDSVIARALEKIPDGLNNLRVIRGNANEIEDMFKNEISLLYLNFSDPWPKQRHALRRLTSPVFLEKYDTIFIGDKKIVQKTDNRHLFEYSLLTYSEYGYVLKEISLNLHEDECSTNIMTEFEEKFVKQGKPIYRVVAVKNNQ